jgi:allantoin racemase
MLPRASVERPDAIVIACFDDTGLAELRAEAQCPVIGIGQAAFHTAALLGQPFSVVTTLPVSIPVIAENIARYGFAPLCRKVRASGLPVLAVEAASPAALARLSDEIDAAAREDGVASVILGCSGMAPLRAGLQARTSIRLIDGVAASARLAAALA